MCAQLVDSLSDKQNNHNIYYVLYSQEKNAAVAKFSSQHDDFWL